MGVGGGGGEVAGCKLQLFLGLVVPGKHRASSGHVHLPGGIAYLLSHRCPAS